MAMATACLDFLPCIVLNLQKKGRKIGKFSLQEDIYTCKKRRSGRLTNLLTISCQNVTIEKFMCFQLCFLDLLPCIALDLCKKGRIIGNFYEILICQTIFTHVKSACLGNS